MNPILSSDQYTVVPTYDLLSAAEQGFVGVDHRFLHALVDHPEKSIPDLARFAVETRPNPRADLSEDLIQIFRHLRAPEALPFLIGYFGRHHEDASIPLICAFQQIGAPAVEPLLDLYQTVKSEDSSDAAFLLGSLGVRDPRILDTLIERLQIDPIDAGHCLAAYGDPAAIPAIEQAIVRVKDEDWKVRSLRFCVDELQSAQPDREAEPFDLWELFPTETDPRFDLLTAKETELFLDSSDRDNRFAAVAVLSEQTTPKRLWDKLLKMAREDPDTLVRGECWQALIDGWDRADIRDAMRAVLADESASIEERSGALRSLAGREGEKPDIQKWMLNFYEDPSKRAMAVQAMAISEDPKFTEPIRKSLHDQDKHVQAQAILGVALMDLAAEAPKLVPFFKDDDLRNEALMAYAMCAPSERSRDGYRALVKKIDDAASGLNEEESATVKDALNTRAERNELEPVFGPDGEPLPDEPAAAPVKAGRNDPCPCGSGKKYKKCCGA